VVLLSSRRLCSSAIALCLAALPRVGSVGGAEPTLSQWASSILFLASGSAADLAVKSGSSVGRRALLGGHRAREAPHGRSYWTTAQARRQGAAAARIAGTM